MKVNQHFDEMECTFSLLSPRYLYWLFGKFAKFTIIADFFALTFRNQSYRLSPVKSPI